MDFKPLDPVLKKANVSPHGQQGANTVAIGSPADVMHQHEEQESVDSMVHDKSVTRPQVKDEAQAVFNKVMPEMEQHDEKTNSNFGKSATTTLWDALVQKYKN